MLKEEIYLGECSIIEMSLFGGEKKTKQLEKILLAFDRNIQEFRESFNPTIGYWRPNA